MPDVPWMRSVPGVAADAPSAFYRTFVRPDEDRPYAKVLLVAMDLRQLDLDMEAGMEDPEPLTGPHGSGRLPRDPAVYRRVAAAFNGAFKTEHGHYGMMVHKRVLLPPVPGSATVVVLNDGRVGFGTWGADHKVGGIAGVDDGDIVSFRQNLEALLDRGQVNPTGRSLWGFTLPGKGAQTERTGLCVTTSGHLVYAWGDDVSATTLARAMKLGGCDYAMHLDMNPYHTGFLFTAIEDLAGKKYRSALLAPSMSIPTERYIQYAPKDFFYVLVHDPAPAVARRGIALGGGRGRAAAAALDARDLERPRRRSARERRAARRRGGPRDVARACGQRRGARRHAAARARGRGGAARALRRGRRRRDRSAAARAGDGRARRGPRARRRRFGRPRGVLRRVT